MDPDGSLCDMSGSQSNVMNLIPLRLHESHGLFCNFFSQHSKGGSSISKNHTYHGSIHLIPVTMDGSLPGCPNQPLICSKKKVMQQRQFQWNDASMMEQERGQMSRSKCESTCLWSSVRDLWDELVTGPLCPVPHVVQSIHLGVEDKRGQSTCIFQLGHSLAHLTYGVIWFACSPAHLLGWGMFTEAVSRKAGKPDISNSMLDAHIRAPRK